MEGTRGRNGVKGEGKGNTMLFAIDISLACRIGTELSEIHGQGRRYCIFKY